MRAGIVVVVIGILLAGAAFLGFQWWRLDSAVTGLHQVQGYLFNVTGLSALAAWLLFDRFR